MSRSTSRSRSPPRRKPFARRRHSRSRSMLRDNEGKRLKYASRRRSRDRDRSRSRDRRTHMTSPSPSAPRRTRDRSGSRSSERGLNGEIQERYGRNRSRSRDHDRNSHRTPSVESDSDRSEWRKDRMWRKSEKKKVKKKKKHKKDKQKQDHALPSSDDSADPALGESKLALPSTVQDPADTVTFVAPAPTDNALSFFARLKQQESQKEMIGTLHASGVKAQSVMSSASDQWECSKAGCGHKNSKYAGACNKCGAMKRMSEWR